MNGLRSSPNLTTLWRSHFLLAPYSALASLPPGIIWYFVTLAVVGAPICASPRLKALLCCIQPPTGPPLHLHNNSGQVVRAIQFLHTFGSGSLRSRGRSSPPNSTQTPALTGGLCRDYPGGGSGTLHPLAELLAHQHAGAIAHRRT